MMTAPKRHRDRISAVVRIYPTSPLYPVFLPIHKNDPDQKHTKALFLAHAVMSFLGVRAANLSIRQQASTPPAPKFVIDPKCDPELYNGLQSRLQVIGPPLLHIKCASRKPISFRLSISKDSVLFDLCKHHYAPGSRGEIGRLLTAIAEKAIPIPLDVAHYPVARESASERKSSLFKAPPTPPLKQWEYTGAFDD